MKKFLSCVLAIALVFSLMSMTVFAATTKNVVGTHGVNNALKDGVTSPDGNTNADVTVSFVGNSTGEDGKTIENRYAIDITYNDLIIDLSDITLSNSALAKKIVWDVNNHYYVPADADDKVVEDDTGNAPLTIEAFQITNHSDLPINYTASYAAEANTSALSVVLSHAATQVPVASATAGTYDATTPVAGTATTGTWETLTATPAGTGATWLDTVNALSAAGVATDAKIGTITVTIAKGSNVNP